MISYFDCGEGLGPVHFHKVYIYVGWKFLTVVGDISPVYSNYRPIKVILL